MALLGLGAVLLLHGLAILELSLGWLAPLVTAVLGSVLLATGLSRRP